MTITNIHPRVPGCKEQQPIAGDSLLDIANAVEDLRYRTLMDDDELLFVATHQFAIEGFREVMEQGRVDLARVKFLVRDPIEKVIRIPATSGSQLVNAFDGEVVSDLGPQPATKEKIKINRYLDWGRRKDVRHIASKAKDADVLVAWEPDEDDLAHLSELPKHIDLVIYHQVSEKFGVVIEGAGAVDVWDTKTEVENEKDLPPVIKGISHEGESTWIGALPKVGKTWVLLCILLALLTGMPLFGDERLTVPNKAKRCIYLCPEASRGSIKKRLKMLRLIEHLYDPITNPDGRLYLQTLSKGKKIALTDPVLLNLAKGADIFVDTAVRYLEGDENAVKDVRVLTENILNLLAVGARSVWVAHHAPKGFENASTMSLQNMFRGSGEFGAALTNAYGLCTEDEATTKIRLHCICGRDLDESIPDMILQGRPHLFETGNFKVVDADAAPRKAGAPGDSLKQQKIDFARSLEGSYQDKTNAVNEKFGTKHTKSTIHEWLKESAPFDVNE